jgi:hypothetical protein
MLSQVDDGVADPVTEINDRPRPGCLPRFQGSLKFGYLVGCEKLRLLAGDSYVRAVERFVLFGKPIEFGRVHGFSESCVSPILRSTPPRSKYLHRRCVSSRPTGPIRVSGVRTDGCTVSTCRARTACDGRRVHALKNPVGWHQAGRLGWLRPTTGRPREDGLSSRREGFGCVHTVVLRIVLRAGACHEVAARPLEQPCNGLLPRLRRHCLHRSSHSVGRAGRGVGACPEERAYVDRQQGHPLQGVRGQPTVGRVGRGATGRRRR